MLPLLLALAATPVPTPPATDAAPDLQFPGPADAKYPLPIDRQKAADRVKARTDWLRKQWLDDFDATADKSAAGYAEARKAVEAVVACEGRAAIRRADALDARNKALRAAQKANPTDPLFWVLHTVYLSPGVGDDRLELVTDQMREKTYSPYVRAVAYRQAAAEANTGGKVGTRDAFLGECLKVMAELAKLPDPTAAEITDELVAAALSDNTFGPSPGDRYTRLKPLLDAAPERVKHLATGVAWLLAARDDRPDTAAELVPDEQKKRYAKALEAAEKALTAAYTADPKLPDASSWMTEVCVRKHVPRDTLELWVKRAITADPDNATACVAKLDWLRKEFKGDPAELLAFGRQCVRGGRADGFVPEALLDAHRRVKGSDKADYWKKPGVWADLRAVYEPAVAALPADRQVRTRYARVCLWCGHPEAADGQLKAVADKVWVPDFADKEAAAGLRTAVDRALKKKRTDDDD